MKLKKNLLIFLTVASMGNLFGEGTLFAPEKAKSGEARDAFYSYAQLVFIYPGGGLSYVIQKKNLGIQFDANGAFVQGKPLGGLSCSAAYHPFATGGKKDPYAGWNITTGLGVFGLLNPKALYFGPYAPVSLGYQGSRVFFNAGVAIAPVFPDEVPPQKPGEKSAEDAASKNKVNIVPVPTAKLGFRF